MAQSLLERLLASASSRPRSNGNAFISGDYTLQQGTNVTLTQLGSVITIAASLAALTRVRANAGSYLSGDVTFASGTNVTLGQVGSVITINASGGSLPAGWVEADAVDPGDSRHYLARSRPDAATNVDGVGHAFYGQNAIAGTGNGGGFLVSTGIAPGGTGGNGTFVAGGGFTQGGGFSFQSGDGTIGGNFAVAVGDGGTRGKAIFIADTFEIHDQDDFSIIAGSTKTEFYAKKIRTHGPVTVEESTGVGKQVNETAILTTATTTPTLAYSYAIGTSESVSITVLATADNGTTTGEVVKKAVFRRTTGDNSGNANQQGGGSTFDASVAAFKLSHDVTIALNGNTIEVKAVAAAATSTLWAVGVSIVARTGPG